MTFGITASGFSPKRLIDISAEIEASYRSAFGQGIKTTPDTILGKLIGIHADREAALWELAEAVYNSQYPNSASGLSLANIGQITDVAPNPATKSSATVYLAGTPGTIIPAGVLIATQNALDQFAIIASVALVGSQFGIQGITRSGTTATAAAAGHGRTTGNFVFIVGADQAEYNGLMQVTVTDSGHFTYQVAGTPATPATGATLGNPATPASAVANRTGPIPAPADTLNQIVNPVVGWTTVSNYVDAVLGADAETDAAFRVRRVLALRGLGAARQEAILGALLQISGVLNAIVFINDTDSTDGDGRPPHSIECLVAGGADQDIYNTVWNKKAAGIQTYGTNTGAAIDSQGASHSVKFSRATQVNIYLILDVTKDATAFPTDGAARISADVLAYAATLAIGQDVIVTPALVGSFASVPGITGVTVKIGTAPTPTLGNNITISPTQIAVFDSSRITVNVT